MVYAVKVSTYICVYNPFDVQPIALLAQVVQCLMRVSPRVAMPASDGPTTTVSPLAAWQREQKESNTPRPRLSRGESVGLGGGIRLLQADNEAHNRNKVRTRRSMVDLGFRPVNSQLA